MSARIIEAPLPRSATTIKGFLLLWLGQVVSLLGTGLTGFALGVWMYQQNGSVTQLSVIAVCNRLPAIVISPLAGALVDRFDRRMILCLCQLGAGASILSMALAVVFWRLPLWYICIALTVNSALSAFHWPAFGAATTLLVPKKYFGRASGMIATGDALGLILSPMLGALLVVWVKIQGVFLIDFATFIFASATLLSVRFPRPPERVEVTAKKSLSRDVRDGWAHLSARPGLLGLLVFFALTNFLTGFLMVLTTPLILSFTTGSTLGTVLTVGGSGLLLGSLVLSAWGGPRRRVRGLFLFEILCGLCLMLAGFRPSAVSIAVAAFVFYFSRSFIDGCSQAIWQSKIPP
jgi:MFS family permease